MRKMFFIIIDGNFKFFYKDDKKKFNEIFIVIICVI